MKKEVKNLIIYLVACYFAPHCSKFYKKRKLDKEDPYAALEKDILPYNHKGKIILMGDFNARTENNQSLCLSNEEGIADNPFWLEEEGSQKWERVSQDEKGVIKQYGEYCWEFAAYMI